MTAAPDRRDHGRIELIEDRCTSCMICVRECPTWCISITSHAEVVADEPGHHPGRRRERTRNVLDSFDIDWSLCMYCGICIEECPFDALAWAGAHVQAGGSRDALVHDRFALAPISPDEAFAARNAADAESPSDPIAMADTRAAESVSHDAQVEPRP